MSLRSAPAAYVALFVAALAAGGVFAYFRLVERHQPAPPTDAPGKPAGKLVVLVVFDQMRGDYVARWAPHFGTGGFERMKKDGVWYASVQIPYACTSTGPGHASIVTGAPPSVTGIIENEWYDRKAAARVYCCQPFREFALVPPPPKEGTASRGAGTGFSPERLLAETVGDKLKVVTDGKGRVVSLSIKDRTAVLMGGKKPDAVYCFDTRDGLFHTGEYYRDQLHPWVGAFNAEKPAEQWFGKQWTRFREDLDYKAATGQPDDAPGEDAGVGQGVTFPHATDGGLKAVGPKYFEAVETSPFGNELLFELAKKAVAAEKLGQGETTDLLCLSFSSNDIVGHRWGPDSWEVLDITLRSDKLIADLLALLDATVGKDRYTLVVTADHGVCPLPEQKQFPSARRLGMVDVYVPLAKKLNETYPPPKEPTRWFELIDPKEQDAVWAWIYLNHKAVADRGLTVDDVATVGRQWLVEQPFVDAAFTRKDIETGKFEAGSFGAKAKLAYYPERCGDLIVVAKPGVLVTRYPTGTSHGSPQPYDSWVPVLAVGSGVPTLGTKHEKVSSLVVAPILAKALGIDAPKDAVEKSPF